MSIKFTVVGQILLITAVTSLFNIKAMAQSEVAATFEEAYFAKSGDAFESDDWSRQLNTIFGFNRFPELQIAIEGELVNTIYHDGLEQQAGSTALIRTRDLNNPFNTSLGENPNYSFSE
ncbi:hypothetical protein STA3757_25910 [Stanieria sp. NIES-3757]|nr:hypothetical protein STA3757_25910 [Stanieria sp. NIES-3757]